MKILSNTTIITTTNTTIITTTSTTIITNTNTIITIIIIYRELELIISESNDRHQQHLEEVL